MPLSNLTHVALLLAFCQEQSPPPLPDPCQGKVSVAFEQGRLTARFDQVPLTCAVEQVVSRTKVIVVPADSIAGDLTTATVRGLPLEEALRTLFADYDLFFYYGAARDTPPTLRTVWIYPPNSASALRPVPPELWAGLKDFETLLSAPDPETRERAYLALMTRPDQRSRDLVLHGILGRTERDDHLRQRLLSSATTRGFAVPPDLLAQLARTDPAPAMRWMALDALSESPLAQPVAQAALTDPDESVRERAKQILETRRQ